MNEEANLFHAGGLNLSSRLIGIGGDCGLSFRWRLSLGHVVEMRKQH